MTIDELLACVEKHDWCKILNLTDALCQLAAEVRRLQLERKRLDNFVWAYPSQARPSETGPEKEQEA